MASSPQQPAPSPPPWPDIDTLLLDMDGALLDLHYDNEVWNEQVPRAYAALHNVDLAEARETLLAHMREIHGSIEFYSFDYWNNHTGLDLSAVHRRFANLVEYRGGALEFLRAARRAGKRVILATNAHPQSITIKDAQVGICAEVDLVVSSHTIGAPKEDQAYWHGLQAILENEAPFDPARALFADDNEPVLAAAENYGVGHLWCIVTPDSERPARHNLAYPAFDHFADIWTW